MFKPTPLKQFLLKRIAKDDRLYLSFRARRKDYGNIQLSDIGLIIASLQKHKAQVHTEFHANGMNGFDITLDKYVLYYDLRDEKCVDSWGHQWRALNEISKLFDLTVFPLSDLEDERALRWYHIKNGTVVETGIADDGAC